MSPQGIHADPAVPWRRALLAGDAAVLLEFGESIDEETSEKVHRVAKALGDAALPGVRDAVPGYATILVEYDPATWEAEALLLAIAGLRAHAPSSLGRRRHVIPVLYGDEWGPDLQDAAQSLGLRAADVVALHADRDYRIYGLGFSPGFPYCGVLPAQLRLPRRDTPRTKVPAGSVGIAGAQTGVYPLESPGGWHLIGRTPLPLFQWDREQPAALQAGDMVRFRPILAAEYDDLAARARGGEELLQSTPL